MNRAATFIHLCYYKRNISPRIYNDILRLILIQFLTLSLIKMNNRKWHAINFKENSHSHSLKGRTSRWRNWCWYTYLTRRFDHHGLRCGGARCRGERPSSSNVVSRAPSAPGQRGTGQIHFAPARPASRASSLTATGLPVVRTRRCDGSTAKSVTPFRAARTPRRYM